MKTVQKTLFVLTALILFTQTLRHVYVRSLEPTGSVLDRYQSQVSEDIKRADSLDELVKLYDEAHTKVQAANAEAEARRERRSNAADRDNEAKAADDEDEGPNPGREPYKSEALLKSAIQDWESKSNQVFELHFFWFSGLGFLILGLICYTRRFPWLGLALMIAGFSEMIYATCPSFRGLSEKEFDRLLTNKAIYSFISLILLFVLAYIVRIIEVKKERGNAKHQVDDPVTAS